MRMIFTKVTTKTSALLLLLLLSLLDSKKASAFPSQAGHCNAGPINENVNGRSNPHATYPDSAYGGDISNGGYQITFDGVPLDNSMMNNLTVGQNYVIRVEATDSSNNNFFRGLLARLDGDTSTKDSFQENSTSIQLHPTCVTDEVAAITHTNRDDKTAVDFSFYLNHSVTSLPLDVTIVKTSNFGDWFYSRYMLSTGDDSGANNPTAAPANVPTAAPVVPTPLPTANPTDVADGQIYSCGTMEEVVEVPGGLAVSSISRKLAKSSADVLCMLFRITTANEAASLNTISRSSNLADYHIVPVSRSYHGGDWERVAGSYAQGLSISECDDTNSVYCRLNIPLLPNLNEGKYILLSFQHSITAQQEVSRFFHQATFGPTKGMIQSFNYSSSLQENMASYVHGQIYTVPATPHRQYFRKNLDGYISSFEEESSPQISKARSPCDEGSRWAEYSFYADDNGGALEVTYRNDTNDYLLSVKGIPRTILPNWVDTHGNQKRVGGDWILLPSTYEFLGGSVQFYDLTVRAWHEIPGGNPPINITGITHPNVMHLNLPDRASFGRTESIIGGSPWNPFYEYGETLWLNTSLPASDCTNAGIRYNNTLYVYGTLTDGTQVRYARYAELNQNTVEEPIADGGGSFVDYGGACSNVAMDFLNEESCSITTVPNACAGNYEKENVGDAIVVCGSDGEIANNAVGNNIFQLNRQTVFNSDEEQKRTVWTMTALYSEDQLRQKVAWALSQILVITPNQINVPGNSEMYLKYYDIFVRNAFGNYFDVLKEVSYSPMMGEMLSYIGSTSKSYLLDQTGNIAFPDENFAREVMQLFSIGTQMLNMDGTLKLDDQGYPIKSYENSDIQNFARAWTGFERQSKRTNVEARSFVRSFEKNFYDPMKIVGLKRDWSPKIGLGGTYIGDKYPLCVDEPDKAFLRKGAKYRLIGSSRTPLLHDQNKWWIKHNNKFTFLNLNSTSALFSELCNGTPGSCNYQPVVTLESNIDCDSSHPECAVDELRIVEVESDPPVRYEYVKPACVNLAFYDNGKTIQFASVPHKALCAQADIPLAGNACCMYTQSWSQWPATSFCSYSAEKVTFATSQQRCANLDPAVMPEAGQCPWYGLTTPSGDYSNGGYECHQSSEDFWLWGSEDPCILQAKVSKTGTVAIVHNPVVNQLNGNDVFFTYINADLENTNFFKVAWDGENFPDPSNNCLGTSCTLLNGIECVCDVIIQEQLVFNTIPTVSDVISQLHVGGVDVAKFENGEYSLAESNGGVDVWHKGSSNYDQDTVFVASNKYYKNFRSDVQIDSSALSFRNPPQFLNPAVREPRDAIYETDAVLEHYFRHPNVAPFLALRLIQRFGLSNPSPQYVNAVATAFSSGSYSIFGQNFGSGEYGDLAATVSAIIMHDEARNPLLDADPTAGSFREPMVKIISFMRAMELEQAAIAPDLVLVDMQNRLGQMPHSSPGVFSFFLPEYAAPGHIKMASITSPEAQIMTGPKLVSFLNGVFSLVDIGLAKCFGGFGLETYYDFWCEHFINGFRNPEEKNRAFLRFQPSSTVASEIVDEIALLLTGGRLHLEARNLLIVAYEEAGAGEKLLAVQKLFTALPEYHSSGLVEAKTEARQEAGQPVPTGDEYKALIFLSLRGGADSYNMLIPHSGCSGDNDLYEMYSSTRTGLAINKNSLLQINCTSSNQGCNTFGLHPNLGHLKTLYEDEDLLWISNMGVLQEYVDTSNWMQKTTATGLFSHYTQEVEVELTDMYDQQAGRGLGGRIVDILQRNGLTANSLSLAGNSEFLVSSFSQPILVDGGKIDKFDPMSDYPAHYNALEDKVKALNNITSLGSSIFTETWASILHRSLQENNLLYDALQSATLDTTFTDSSIGRQMEGVSKLIKTKAIRGVDRDVFYVAMSGFDSHINLNLSLDILLPQMNSAMAEFTAEMKAQGSWNSVVVVMTSEFSRTLTENTGEGSDHAWGGNYFLAGGGVNGGQILGEYPDSFDPNVDAGIMLEPGIVIPTTPWESMWNGVVRWFGITDAADLSEALPNIGAFPAEDMLTAQELFVDVPTDAPTDAPTDGDGGFNGDPVILGLQNQVFKFDGRDGAWYANLAIPRNKLQWNMQFKQFNSCPADANMFISSMSLSTELSSNSGILLVTTPEPIPECRENPDIVCLGDGTLHISFDGGKSFISKPGDYQYASRHRIVAHNTFGACSRKWHDYDISLNQKQALRDGGRRATVREKKPLQLLLEKRHAMIEPKECQAWIDDRTKQDDLFQQRGQWSTLYIEGPLVSFHVEYRRSDWFDKRCDFQSLDAWMTSVSSELEQTEWQGILGETKQKIYHSSSGEQIVSDRSQLLRGQDDADYEVDGPYGSSFAALQKQSTKKQHGFVKNAITSVIQSVEKSVVSS